MKLMTELFEEIINISDLKDDIEVKKCIDNGLSNI